jgi:glyoxylase-like metal-dependent hydrolase (beta-lactamase superfamily II)
MPEDLMIHTIVSLPFQENTYVLRRPDCAECLVVDPGLEPDLILSLLRERRLTPTAILLTHGHADHIGGNAALCDAYPELPIFIGEKDEVMLGDPFANMSALFGMGLTSPPATRLLREADRLDLAGISLDVLDVPGHSPGHIVYVSRGQPCRVFGGDVLFRGSVGRTDLPGMDGPLLYTGIRNKLFALPGDTIVYPGHGPTTTIAREKATNPFVGENAEP